ncbi:MAG: hypothetical protein K0Q97_1581 [Bacillota bacterium]|jgi:hypothetical protein|nr:hypothetical protein [Bacillota bacterium]
MMDSLKQRCKLFIQNRDIMKDNFKWDNSLMYPLCASIYTDKELEIDSNKVRMCKELIKDYTGIFSNFRSVPYLALTTMLSLEENPNMKFKEILKIYDVLKQEFHSSTYLPISAFVIADIAENQDYEKIVKKSKDIFLKMKKEHPFLTSGEDCGFAVITALSDLSPDAAISEMERCYGRLKSRFFSANAVQSLSHTLAMGEEEVKKKCDKVTYIFDELKERNCKFGTGIELSVLGLLAMITDDTDKIINDIIDVNEYLLSFKGFGAMGIGKTQRIMYAAILVSQEYKKNALNAMNLATVNSVTSIIIAQQVAMSAIIASSAAASTANN